MKTIDCLHPFSMKEMDDMLDEAEMAFDLEDYLTNEEVFWDCRCEPKGKAAQVR